MDKQFISGAFLSIFNMGVLVIGESGIGKSELALGLISRGHQLVSDDAVQFIKNKNIVLGKAPIVLQDFLEVRGIGLLNIRKIFTDTALCEEKQLQLVIKLSLFNHTQMADINRLHGLCKNKKILGIKHPQITIPVMQGRNLAILVEAAVKNQQLKNQGYHADEIFIQRQHNFMHNKE